MKPARLAMLAALACACAPSPAPLHVPGPTTSHPFAPTEVGTGGAVSKVVLRDGARVVAFRVVFAGGSADDPGGKEGLTRLTATTMAEGGTTVRTYSELVEKLYPTAASIDVRVDRDETVFAAEVSAEMLEAFYPLFK